MKKSTIAITTIITLLVSPQIAFSYQLGQTNTNETIHWDQEIVSYKLSNVTPRDLTLANAEDVLIASFETWNMVQGTSITFEYTGRTDNKGIGYDSSEGAVNENIIIWENENWEYDSHTLAVTLKTFQSSTGKIVDSDIIVNGMEFEWGIDGATDKHDVQNTLTHEIGHFLGLEHVDIPEATMYASASIGEILKRELHSDDMMGIRTLYPNYSGSNTDGSVDNFENGQDSDNSYQGANGPSSGLELAEVNFHLSCQTTMGNVPLGKSFILFALIALSLVAVIKRR